MRHQHVGVDVVKMIVSSCSYLALAFAAWVLLRLVQACFYLPGILRRQNEEEARDWLLQQVGLPGVNRGQGQGQIEGEAEGQGEGEAEGASAQPKGEGGEEGAEDLPPPAEDTEGEQVAAAAAAAEVAVEKETKKDI